MGHPSPPPWPIDSALRRALDRAGLAADTVEAWLKDGLRPGYLLASERVGNRPLPTGRIGQWMGRTAAPTLPLVGSKLGGRPYLEALGDWPEGYRFLGQIDFATLPKPIEGALPRRGILVLFMGEPEALEPIRVAWYPSPGLEKALPGTQGRSFGRYEAKLVATPVWLAPETKDGRAFPDPALGDELADLVLDWTTKFLGRQGYQEGKHLLGAAFPQVLTDQFRADEVSVVLRLDFDAGADFSFGSNVVYVVTAAPDFAAGKLERCFGVIANY